MSATEPELEDEARWALSELGFPASGELELLAERGKRRVWRIGDFVLKGLASTQVAQKIFDVGPYLLKNGCPVVARLGDRLVTGSFMSYLVFPYVEGMFPKYSDPETLRDLGHLLRTFHDSSKDFAENIAPIPDKTFDAPKRQREWITNFETVCDKASADPSPFAEAFRAHSGELRRQCEHALSLATDAMTAVTAAGRKQCILSHGDFGCQNVIRGADGSYAIIDIDNIAVSVRSYDLARLVTWADHDLQSWSSERFRDILTYYGKMKDFEMEMLYAELSFPGLCISIAMEYYQNADDSRTSEFERAAHVHRTMADELGVAYDS